MQKHILITQEGFDKKNTELQDLENQRVKALEELNFAREQGDRSENGAYKAARWKLGGIDKRLRILKEIIRRSQIVARAHQDIVEIGATITITMNNQQREFLIVGSEESDLENGRISYVSPIGKAVMGKKKGDECFVTTPGGMLSIAILDIK